MNDFDGELLKNGDDLVIFDGANCSRRGAN